MLLKFGFYFVCVVFITLLPVKAFVPVLIYPPTAPTRTQWITGIGIPLQDLRIESMVTGYVVKAEYFLPDNVTQLKTQKLMPFVSRKFGNHLKLDNVLNATENNVPAKSKQEFLQNNKQISISNYRWTVYKGLEGLANRMGLSGRDCVLKSICEAAETPFHYYNGLFGELLFILLTPSSSADELSTNSDNEYQQAEHLGRSGANCHTVYKNCPRSLLDNFSDIQYLSAKAFNIMG